jgi:rhodanese-related sulfurtransferase
MKTFLALLLVAAFATTTHAAPYPEITLDQVKAAIADKKVVLLDANGTASWQKGHIPGAINFETAKGNLSSVLPQDKGTLIVAYCVCEGCPYYLKAADAATKLGYTNVKHFTPGIYGWRESGSPVEKGS